MGLSFLFVVLFNTCHGEQLPVVFCNELRNRAAEGHESVDPPATSDLSANCEDNSERSGEYDSHPSTATIAYNSSGSSNSISSLTGSSLVTGSSSSRGVDGWLERDMGKWYGPLVTPAPFYAHRLDFRAAAQMSHSCSFALSCPDLSLLLTTQIPPSHSPPRCHPFRVLGHCQILLVSPASTSTGSNTYSDVLF